MCLQRKRDSKCVFRERQRQRQRECVCVVRKRDKKRKCVCREIESAYVCECRENK